MTNDKHIDKKLLNEKFQRMRKNNKILILISILLIVLLVIFSNGIINENIKYLVIIDSIFLGITFIGMLINVLRMMKIIKIVKTMYTKEEIEEARRKKNEIKHK